MRFLGVNFWDLLIYLCSVYVFSGESGGVTLGALYTICRDKTSLIRQDIGIDENSRIFIVNTEGDTDPEGYWDSIWG